MKLADFRLQDHAVEVCAWTAPEVFLWLCRDHGNGYRCLLAAHCEAGVAPTRFRDIEFVTQPVGRLNDLGPTG